jgi:hypothetical protein
MTIKELKKKTPIKIRVILGSSPIPWYKISRGMKYSTAVQTLQELYPVRAKT